MADTVVSVTYEGQQETSYEHAVLPDEDTHPYPHYPERDGDVWLEGEWDSPNLVRVKDTSKLWEK